MLDPGARGALADAMRAFAPFDPREGTFRDRILAFLDRHHDPFDRNIAEGHLTGSAFVVDAAFRKVLLVRHRKLQRWLQPGGHAQPGEGRGEDVALREAREETGLPSLTLHPRAPRPLDLDVHVIPARPGEPAHEHLDLRYLVVTADTAARRCEVETEDLRWFAWEELAVLDLDPGLRRGLEKARRYAAG